MQWTAEGSVFGAVSLWFFCLCMKYLRTAERICVKFPRKTCVVPRLDKFEGHCERPRSPGTKQHFSALLAACVRFMFGKTSLASGLFLVFSLVLGLVYLKSSEHH